jgi:ABC-type uncharacterized transport system permease subunit
VNNEIIVLIISILNTTIRMATPLAFASIAGTISEKAGIIALGLEGYMVAGAFTGVVFAHYFGSAIIGVIGAAIGGAVIGLIFGILCVRYKADQIVAGLGVNILTPGLASVLMVAIWDNKGKSDPVSQLAKIDIPIIRNIPIIGDIISGHISLFYVMLLVMLISWIIIYKTPLGIRLRATGENSDVVDSIGLSSNKIKFVAVIISAVLAAIGGSFLSLGQLNFYSKDMVAGRGFIAVAIFVFAKWNPVHCVLVSLLFGFTEALQLRLQTLAIPSQFLSMLPYIFAIVVLSGFVGKKYLNN